MLMSAFFISSFFPELNLLSIDPLLSPFAKKLSKRRNNSIFYATNLCVTNQSGSPITRSSPNHDIESNYRKFHRRKKKTRNNCGNFNAKDLPDFVSFMNFAKHES